MMEQRNLNQLLDGGLIELLCMSDAIDEQYASICSQQNVSDAACLILATKPIDLRNEKAVVVTVNQWCLCALRLDRRFQFNPYIFRIQAAINIRLPRTNFIFNPIQPISSARQMSSNCLPEPSFSFHDMSSSKLQATCFCLPQRLHSITSRSSSCLQQSTTRQWSWLSCGQSSGFSLSWRLQRPLIRSNIAIKPHCFLDPKPPPTFLHFTSQQPPTFRRRIQEWLRKVFIIEE